MIEKLLENWLDNASERSYQAPFVQILSAQGYKVVHSTRHTVLEYGKDVLAISPDGAGCVYQLKSHRGGRMGLNEFRNEVQPQLVQVMSQVAAYPGFPEPPYRAYLVSNGYFEEEVHRAVDDLNRMPYPNKVSLISRGNLLGWCNQYAVPLWPSELRDSRLLLEVFLWDPKDILPTTKLSQLIGKILSLEPLQANLSGYPEYYRAVTSSALLTGIAISGFAEAQNHYAVTSAWTLLAISIIAAAEKQGFNLDGIAGETLRLAETAAIDALSQLWNEVTERKSLVQGDAFSDPEIYGWRYTTLLGLLSCLALYDDEHFSLTEESRRKLEQWLIQRHSNVDLWGEGAVANLVPWIVWLRKHDATLRVDFEIESLVRTVVTRNQGNSTFPLASPYYSYEKIARSRLPPEVTGQTSMTTQETFAGSTFTAEPLFHMLVRTNLKQTCKRLWSDFTKLLHRGCVPDSAWEYCTLAIRSGADVTKLYPPTYNWADFRKEAIQLRSGFIPATLSARPCLVALWWQVAPYRYTTESSKIFIEGVFPGWGKWSI